MNVNSPHTVQKTKPNKHSPKDDKEAQANKHRGCSVSLIFRKIQIKITMRYDFTLTRIAVI